MTIINQQVRDDYNNPLRTIGNQVAPMVPMTRSALPKQNSSLEDFGFYICRLEAKNKRQLVLSVDPCSISLNMTDTLSDN